MLENPKKKALVRDNYECQECKRQGRVYSDYHDLDKHKRLDIDHIKEIEAHPELALVGRYLKHIEMYRRMEKTVKKEGVSIVVRNGSQSYVKHQPLLGAMKKINDCIMNIERSFSLLKNRLRVEQRVEPICSLIFL